MQHRLHAARAALQAAAGQAHDETPPDDAVKAKLRGQALDWLKAELTVWDRLLASGAPQDRPSIARNLWHWQTDTDLAGIRDREALARLPAAEQKALTHLWADAAELLTKAGGLHALPAAEQVEEVRKELKKRNPGFDGPLTHRIEGGVVVRMSIDGKNVTDLSPVRHLVGLRAISCTNGPLSDLSPLKGLPLAWLDLHGTQVRDLAPLKGMPLASLHLWWCGQVQDLEPLRGMQLRQLDMNACGQVQDLEPLKGMPLMSLYINGSKVRDLAPLKDMKLAFLACNNTAVSDLSPLKGMPLKTLFIHETGVVDLRPLQGMPLEVLHLIPGNITQGLDVIRDMKRIKTIGTGWFDKPAWPPAEFWDRYDKGEFKK